MRILAPVSSSQWQNNGRQGRMINRRAAQRVGKEEGSEKEKEAEKREEGRDREG